MFVSYKWLSEYLDLTKITPTELAENMSLTGIEVESVVIPEEGLKKIVVGEVVECIDHPDSDHLHICQVDIGAEELSQIICGAPNVKAGIKVIVALPGSRIANHVKIKKGKMRGQVSNGMICSLAEIGYAESVIPKEYADGIQYLPENAVPGESVFPYLSMDDALVELSITPNRADALSMRGVAYEVGAIYRQTPNFHESELVEVEQEASEKISITVEDEKDSPSYQIRIIENVTIAPSPQWLQNRLMNAGIRPINNVVDVTNYILLLFGQPLHAFDYDCLGSQEILVRRADDQEELVTLDGETRVLSKENIVITNGEKPLALAGVMGGLDSEISEATTTVALEAALFDPLSIRRTSKQFNLRSESSARFEKGINRGTIDLACEAAATMIAELSGGQVLKGAVKGSQVVAQSVDVAIDLERINNYLGTELTVSEVNEIFVALGFLYTEEAEHYVVTVPPRRWDISIEADIIEEVARIYGYNRLPSTLPKGETVAGSLTRQQRLTRRIRGFLEGDGLSEAISYALTTEDKATAFLMDTHKPIHLDWPMTEDRSSLRINLISGLLDDVAYNVARKNQELAFYEIGRVFYQSSNSEGGLPKEENHLAIALSGEWQSRSWQNKVEMVNFYHAKGVIDQLLVMLSIEDQVRFEQTAEIPEMHPGRSAAIYLGTEKIGFVGQVHPAFAKKNDLPETYVAELNLEVLLTEDVAKVVYQPVSKFPAVSRDIALLVNATIPNQDIVELIRKVAGKLLTEVELFDVYQGTNIEAGHKSLAYRLTFANPEATLTDEEIQRALEKVTKALTETFAAAIR